jgi:sugar lactone lactonase YvrE
MKWPVLKLTIIATCLLFPAVIYPAGAVKVRHLLSLYGGETEGGLKQPEGVSCDGKSGTIVADTGNGRLLRFTIQDRDSKTVGEIKIPQLSHPIRVQTNSKGDIYAIDGKRRRIVRLSSEGTFKSYLKPRGLPSPTSYVPKSLKIDKNDNLFILDVFSGRVLVLDAEGKYLRHIDFPENYGFLSDLSVDSKGHTYVIDSLHKRVFSVSRDSAKFSPLTESLKEYVDFPTSIASDNKGRLYVLDQSGGGVVILGQDGSFLGRRLRSGWKEGLLRSPTQLCINEKEEILIADRDNNRVQIFAIIK